VSSPSAPALRPAPWCSHGTTRGRRRRGLGLTRSPAPPGANDTGKGGRLMLRRIRAILTALNNRTHPSARDTCSQATALSLTPTDRVTHAQQLRLTNASAPALKGQTALIPVPCAPALNGKNRTHPSAVRSRTWPLTPEPPERNVRSGHMVGVRFG
jgi:hypothetical protein